MTNEKYERLAQRMLAAYESAEATMMEKVARRLIKGIDQPGWAERKYAEVAAVRRETSAALKRLKRAREQTVRESIASAYAAGQGTFETDMERFVSSLGVRTGKAPNAAKVARILNELTSSLDAADRTILRRVDDAYATIIGTSAAQVVTGSITVRRAVQDALNCFADRGITSFVDKRGSRWDMATYAEMALLTAIENATVEGYTDTMQSYGFDLATISEHAGACPLCSAWQGVIVSVSGTNPDYPSLDDARGAGVFHPRCLHHLSTYYEGISPAGRAKPRNIAPPSQEYTARTRQRHCERMIRQWKRRMAVAMDEQEERYAYRHVRQWQAEIRQLIRSSPAVLPRKYEREGGRQTLRFNPRKKKK